MIKKEVSRIKNLKMLTDIIQRKVLILSNILLQGDRC